VEKRWSKLLDLQQTQSLSHEETSNVSLKLHRFHLVSGGKIFY